MPRSSVVTSRRPEPSQLPRRLPHGLISGQLAHGRMLLCLDFDGTLSELTNDPWLAFPLPRAKDAVAELARHPEKLAVAIVSGRDLDTLIALLGLHEGLLFAGTHGLEFIGRDGNRRLADGIERCLSDLDQVREFLAQNMRWQGLIIEDKGFAITLNYRNAGPVDAREALAAFDQFVSRRPTLEVLHGKMIHEAIPRGIGGKGEAVEFFMRETGVGGPATTYVGDDITDEDAFRALTKHRGVGILVGRRPSFAPYHLEGPAEVAALLEELAAIVKR